MQSRAGELTNETMVVDIEEIEGTTLEERLIAMRRVLCVLENHVEENYEKFKVGISDFNPCAGIAL